MAKTAAWSAPGSPPALGEPIHAFKQERPPKGMRKRILVWLLVVVPLGFIGTAVLLDVLTVRTPSASLGSLLVVGLCAISLVFFSIPIVKQLRLYRSQRDNVALLYREC